MTEEARGPLANRRILVAEDEYMSMLILQDLLAELDAEVVGSVSSVEGVMRGVDEHKPDAVTLDVNLKGEPVYAAAKVLRERGVPFVFVTGYGALPGCPPELEDAPRVKKPFSLAELAQGLEAALSDR